VDRVPAKVGMHPHTGVLTICYIFFDFDKNHVDFRLLKVFKE
jgi:hypothetical protein